MVDGIVTDDFDAPLPTTDLPLAQRIVEDLAQSLGDVIFATELAFSQGARRCDLWTISPNSSAGFKARAYEIKISRSDFKRDSAIKQREARLFSDQFFYVTPAGLLKKEEVPDWAGLIEWEDGSFKTVIGAPFRDKDAPSWELVVSLIRNSGSVNRDTDLLKQRLRIAEKQVREASRKIRAAGRLPWQFGLPD